MVAKHLRSKEAFLEFLRSRGLEPDQRQDDRSLALAVFPVTSEEFSDELSAICVSIREHFIAVTSGHVFASRIGQLTFSPYLSTVGPRPSFHYKLSHRPSEDHVFASVVLDPHAWRSASRAARWSLVVAALLGCIERIRDQWVSDTDRSDLMGVVLSHPKSIA